MRSARLFQRINKGYVPNVLLLALSFCYTIILFPNEYVTYKIIIWLTTVVIALCLFKINKILFRIFLISMGLLAAIYYPINILFGPVTPANIEAVMSTDYVELTSYLSIIPFNIYLKSILLFLFPVFFSFLTYRFLSLRFSWLLVVLVAGLYLSNRYHFTNVIHNKSWEGAFNTIPTKVLGNIFKFYAVTLKGMKYQASLMNKTDDWIIESKNIDKELYIFIIGESVRSDVFSDPKLFSSHPLDSIYSINFENAISYAYITIPSLRNAFVLRKPGGNNEPYFPDNIVNLAKKAGAHTEWFSNQGFVGEDDNYISAIARCADYSEFLNKKQYFNTRKSDVELLNILKRRLAQSKNNHNMYFLHTIGSHPSACKITNGKYDKYRVSNEVSCYIKSIENSKNLIYEIYQLAKNTGKTFNIVYFSDHGLTYNYDNKIFIHSDDIKQGYMIPLFILGDNFSENVTIKAHRNLGDFINFFQQLTGIKAEGVNYDYRFISEDYDKSWNYLIGGLDFNQFKNNPIPFD